MQYSDFTTYMQNMLQIADNQGVALFNGVVGAMVDYVENRLFRDLDLINTVEAATSTCTPSSRNVVLPTNMVIAQSLNIITPAGSSPDAGTRNAVQRMAVQFIDYVFPNATAPTTPSIPIYFAVLDDQNVRLGPAPDAAYTAEFIGSVSPTQLSASNATNVYSLWFPDLYVALGMVFGSGYQREFGLGMDKGMAQYWEGIYQQLLMGADTQERRKKAQAANGRVNTPPVPQMPTVARAA